MSFRIAVVEALLLAALICCVFPAAKAQSTGGQHILFSSPDGQITSNAPLPMAQAPQPRDTSIWPAADASGHQFPGPTAPPLFFQPPPPMLQDNPTIHDDFREPMNVRKDMGELTAAQIMDVPTAEQIFGLAEKTAKPQKEPGQFDNGDTNVFGAFTNSIFGEPAWAKALPDDTEKNPGLPDTESSNTTASASGFFGGLFDSARNDNRFGSHDANNSDSVFGSSQPATQQQSSWDSALTGSAFATPVHTLESAPNNIAAPVPVISSSSLFASQSPFGPPQVRPMDTLPQLPTLPSLPGQNSQSFQPPSITPSWGPKPPPWTTPQTPFATPITPTAPIR